MQPCVPCHSSTRFRHTPSASGHVVHCGRTSCDFLYANLMSATASSSGGRPAYGAGSGTSRQVRPCNPARHAAERTLS
jgi:hypothetical protein